MDAWRGFKEGNWKDNIDVTEFIRLNYTEYLGDDSFLEGPTEATTELWKSLSEKFKVEREKGIYDAETKIPSQIDAYGAGYINKDLEKIVGLQTDAPLKRAIFPNGGLRMVKNSLEAFGYELDPQTEEIFTKYRKTHNDGVFSAYTEQIRKARHTGIITGLPDAYGRGRIIGDYRRVALYGVDRLIADREEQYKNLDPAEMTEDVIRLREEVFEQVKALKALKRMAAAYGFDISGPATNGSQFFITEKDTPWLTNHHTIFGQVIKGEEVISLITSEKTNEADKPLSDVKINKIEIIRVGKEAEKFDAPKVFDSFMKEQIEIAKQKEAEEKAKSEKILSELAEQESQAIASPSLSGSLAR